MRSASTESGDKACSEVARLFVNFFQPSFKLASKTRVGARVTKRYHLPATPATRLLESKGVPEEMKAKLRGAAAGQLLEEPKDGVAER